MPEVNLFPLLVNEQGRATRHEFVGFWAGKIEPSTGRGDLSGPVKYWHPIFRCTETGMDRAYGYLDPDAPLTQLYGTNRRYEGDSV